MTDIKIEYETREVEFLKVPNKLKHTVETLLKEFAKDGTVIAIERDKDDIVYDREQRQV